MEKENCVFCKIADHEIPTTPVYEDEDLIAINDRDPKAPFHVLIMPKVHIANLDSLTEENLPLIAKIFVTARNIAKEKGISGRYKVVTNVGELAGQTVFHMHFHMLGGWTKKEDVVSQLKQ